MIFCSGFAPISLTLEPRLQMNFSHVSSSPYLYLREKQVNQLKKYRIYTCGASCLENFGCKIAAIPGVAQNPWWARPQFSMSRKLFSHRRQNLI